MRSTRVIVSTSLSASAAQGAAKLAALLEKQSKLKEQLLAIKIAIKDHKAALRAAPKTGERVPVAKKLEATPVQAGPKSGKLPMACTETADIPAKLLGKFSSRMRTLEKKHGIVRAGVTTVRVDAKGIGYYIFHYARQPGWAAFKSAIRGLWSSFVGAYPEAKKNMK